MRALRFSLAAAVALALGGIAVALVQQSPAEEVSWVNAAFAVPVGVGFALSGLVAMWRRPENATGRLMAAVGYLWFIGALVEVRNEWVFTVAFLFSNVTFVAFVALVLAYPTGRLETRFERILVLATAVLSLVSLALLALLDETPNGCEQCPHSTIVVRHSPGAARVVDLLGWALAVAIVAGMAVVLVRRWRAATPRGRRVLAPVLVTGSVALLVLILGGLVSDVEPAAEDAASAIFLLVFLSVPVSFLVGVLRTRLARGSAARAFVSLEEGASVRDALSDALGDPSLSVSYRLESQQRWVDADGRAAPEPTPSPGRSVTPIERGRRTIAAVTHDAALNDEPDLVQTVAGAAGLAIQNERLQADLRAQFGFLKTIVETMPALLVVVDTGGLIVDVNPSVAAAYGLGSEEQIIGRPFWDVFISPDERKEMIDRFWAAAPEHAAAEYENRFTNARGEERVIAWRSAPVVDETGDVVSIVSGGVDITDLKRQENELRASRARLVEAETNERRRLERNLHDGAQQRLVALLLSLRLAESRLKDDPTAAQAMLAASQEQLSGALEELRELARGIHPAMLTERGLQPAVQALAARAPMPVEVHVADERLPESVEAAAYYVVAEGLTNMAKYAYASSGAVSVWQENGLVTVEVSDNGAGGADSGAGSGLRGLADRVAALDGSLDVISPPGGGTRLRATIPVRGERS